MEEEYRKIFVKKLNYYMNLKGINQTDIMHHFDLSSSTVSNWCTGVKLPRMGKIQMLADYFGVNISDLLTDNPEKNKPPEKNSTLSEGEEYLLELFRKIPDDKKQLAIEMLKAALQAK